MVPFFEKKLNSLHSLLQTVFPSKTRSLHPSHVSLIYLPSRLGIPKQALLPIALTSELEKAALAKRPSLPHVSTRPDCQADDGAKCECQRDYGVVSAAHADGKQQVAEKGVFVLRADFGRRGNDFGQGFEDRCT